MSPSTPLSNSKRKGALSTALCLEKRLRAHIHTCRWKRQKAPPSSLSVTCASCTPQLQRCAATHQHHYRFVHKLMRTGNVGFVLFRSLKDIGLLAQEIPFSAAGASVNSGSLRTGRTGNGERPDSWLTNLLIP
jgi:hypothetical protein